jgi:hypothetical protein
MNSKKFDMDLIKYMSGDCSEEEKLEIEEKLKTDPELRAKLDDYQHISNVLESEASWQRIKKNIVASGISLDEGRPILLSSRRAFRPLAVAASIMLLVSLSAMLFLNSEQGLTNGFKWKNKPTKLIASRGSVSDADLALNETKRLIYESHYAEALALIEEHESDGGYEPHYMKYKLFVLLQDPSKYEEAGALLKTIQTRYSYMLKEKDVKKLIRLCHKKGLR